LAVANACVFPTPCSAGWSWRLEWCEIKTLFGRLELEWCEIKTLFGRLELEECEKEIL